MQTHTPQCVRDCGRFKSAFKSSNEIIYHDTWDHTFGGVTHETCLSPLSATETTCKNRHICTWSWVHRQTSSHVPGPSFGDFSSPKLQNSKNQTPFNTLDFVILKTSPTACRMSTAWNTNPSPRRPLIRRVIKLNISRTSEHPFKFHTHWERKPERDWERQSKGAAEFCGRWHWAKRRKEFKRIYWAFWNESDTCSHRSPCVRSLKYGGHSRMEQKVKVEMKWEKRLETSVRTENIHVMGAIRQPG